MTYYSEKKDIKNGQNPVTSTRYGNREDMEYQYCLYRANAVRNEGDNNISSVEWGTVEDGVIERKVYAKDNTPEPAQE